MKSPAEGDAHDGDQQKVSVRVADSSNAGGDSAANLAITIDGQLSIRTLSKAWDAAFEPILKNKPKQVAIDATNLSYCDGAGLGLFLEMRRTLKEWDGELRLEHLRPEMQRLVDMATLADPAAPQLAPPQRPGAIIAMGRSTSVLLTELQAMISFLGEICVGIVWAIFHPRQLRWRDLLMTADKVGTDAVPVIALLGFIIGSILAFQSAPALDKLGGRDFIPTLVTVAVVRELGPLIACILMAGRTASAFAAELGTMTVTEEINALRAMGLDPVRFLAVPRVLAGIAMAPLLSIISSSLGVLGGYSVMVNYGFSFQHYAVQARNAIDYKDLLGGEAKTLVFGLIIAGVGCLRGLRTASGPGAVGDSTTRAVVTSIVLIILADGVFGVVYFYMGL